MKQFLVLLLLLSGPVLADTPMVTDVRILPTGTTATISVTVRHADTGWDHYADAWEIRIPSGDDPDGQLLATRVLHHPHVTEQPFTRSLSDVEIPPGTQTLIIRAHDTVHGWGPGVTVSVP